MNNREIILGKYIIEIPINSLFIKKSVYSCRKWSLFVMNVLMLNVINGTKKSDYNIPIPICIQKYPPLQITCN